MKKIFFPILFLLCSFIAYSQPTTITYQGKLLDANNMPVNESAVAFTFAIYDAETGGNKIWPPNNSAATKSIDIVNGLYSVILGTGSGNDEAIEPGIFNGITPYLEVGVNATTLPRTSITSVPFSILSNNLSSSAWASPGSIGSTAPNSAAFSNLTVGTGSNSFALPVTRGTNGQVLASDGTGNTIWSTPTQGTVTSVTGTAPIVSSGGATPTISINAATTSAAGSMSAADKTKLDGIAANANNYTHPTGDGNLHVPATGTTNAGKVLTAGATAGALSWETPASGGGSSKQYIVKATNTDRVDQTVISDDPHLSVSLSANKKYFIRISVVSVRLGTENGRLRSGIRYSGQASSDYCAINDFKPDAIDGSGVTWNNSVIQDDISFLNSVGSAPSPDDFEIVINTTTAGTFAYQWGNRDIDGREIRVLKGSFMIVEELP
ncbi:MAG: hypothetical protein KIT33_11340 [Candidatus Kapabacteria bacterium]|nr:hypothetical protein [Ignavibacteriota bacterium]MCW5885552.1 hypothetical protein [Candidatus Kapabacteria bacterium]